jgi:N-acetylmuramoyl-L-alanine amidase
LEQDITYRVGQELAELLRADPNFEVRLSRPTPESTLGTSNSTSLRARVDDANSWGADAFISIHTNASENADAGGVEAFSYASPSVAFSLGEDILRQLSNATGFRNRGMKVRPGLYVLRRTAMPAVLVEIGFITNPQEAARMDQDPALFARGIYDGILEYYR